MKCIKVTGIRTFQPLFVQPEGSGCPFYPSKCYILYENRSCKALKTYSEINNRPFKSSKSDTAI